MQSEHVDPSTSDEEDTGGSAVRRRRGGGLFATRRGGTAENEYALEKVWAKRWINEATFYLVQWEEFHELTWEPVANIPWLAVRGFSSTWLQLLQLVSSYGD